MHWNCYLCIAYIGHRKKQVKSPILYIHYTAIDFVVDRSRALRDAHVIFRTFDTDTIIVQFAVFEASWRERDMICKSLREQWDYLKPFKSIICRF